MTQVPVAAEASPPLGSLYGDAFYQDQFSDSERSAREYIPYLWTLFQPAQVLDVGCGRGAWLKVFLEQGVTTALGFDGPWNTAGDMADPRIAFTPIELDKPFAGRTKVDLAMTLEVAEHLPPEASNGFVESLASSSDAVMFGSAFSGQGGTHHINERPHSFWGKLFDEAGFDVFDVFRPRFWGNDRVCFWYRQNTFLYLRRGSPVHAQFVAMGLSPLADVSFLDCVHPELFERPAYVSPPSMGVLLRQVTPAFIRSVRRRLAGGRGI